MFYRLLLLLGTPVLMMALLIKPAVSGETTGFRFFTEAAYSYEEDSHALTPFTP